MPDRVESFREVDRGKNCPINWLGLLKSSKMDCKKNRFLSRVDGPGRKLAWPKERMKLNCRKKSRRDRMMRSKCFEMQKMRKIGRKEPRESRGFPILKMKIKRKYLADGKRNISIRKSLKYEEENSCPSEEDTPAWDKQL